MAALKIISWHDGTQETRPPSRELKRRSISSDPENRGHWLPFNLFQSTLPIFCADQQDIIPYPRIKYNVHSSIIILAKKGMCVCVCLCVWRSILGRIPCPDLIIILPREPRAYFVCCTPYVFLAIQGLTLLYCVKHD